MKVKMHLPAEYTGRSYIKPSYIIKAKPKFNVEAFNDMGNRIEQVPSTLYFGTDLYKALTQYFPAIAASLNEDLKYEGEVDSLIKRRPQYNYYGHDDNLVAPIQVKDGKYAYYGLGKNYFGLPSDDGITLLGFGDTESPPDSKYGYSTTGIPNFMYSKRLDEAAQPNSVTKSKILTNILNDSLDFNPLFAPLHPFKDMEYDAEQDIEGKGPRPTDHWLPVFKDGRPVLRPDGTQVYRPIPLKFDLPIYNFKHPGWANDPEDFFYSIRDLSDVFAFDKMGTAPSYADYDGTTSRTPKGTIRERDYPYALWRLAAKPGYFEWWPDIKEKAPSEAEKFKSIKKAVGAQKQFARKFENARKFYNDDVARLQEEQDRARAANVLNNKDMSTSNIKRFYKVMAHKALTDNDPASLAYLETLGLTKEDEPALKEYIMNNTDFSGYNMLDDDLEKRNKLLLDFSDYKNKKDSQNNITAAVSGGLNV